MPYRIRRALAQDSRRAAVPIGEGVDANPLGVRPGAEVDDGGESVGVHVLAGREKRVQGGSCPLQCPFERAQLLGDLARRHALQRANLHAGGRQAGLSAKPPQEAGGRDREARHRIAVPPAQVLERRDVAAQGTIPGVTQHPDEVPAEPRAVRVPVSHE